MRYLTLVVLLLLSSSVHALEADYIKAKKLFWEKLYTDEFSTLYCSQKKSYAGDPKKSEVSVEQVYPDTWVAEELGCRYKNNCRHPVFKGASSDLHNLWPVMKKYDRARGKRVYSDIDGNKPVYDDGCDFETDRDLAEPADDKKGEIARTILYMINTYHLSPRGMLPTLVEWHNSDPVSAEEKRRNKLIFELQGRSNPFIEKLEAKEEPKTKAKNSSSKPK